VFQQRVVVERPDVIVTLGEPAELPAPLTHDGTVMLDVGALAVWFTFPGAWHDIARFHDDAGRFTGVYANVLTPPVIDGPVWRTTDLFLDVWIPSGGAAVLLDEDELVEAEEAGSIDASTARRARQEAHRLIERAAVGSWPPPIVSDWPLERALVHLSRSG
jgi:predicted RNA-binding protein associated with RNAse of E/G family